MKRILIVILVLGVLIGGAYAVVGQGKPPAPSPAVAVPSPATVADHVVAEAKIVPVRSAALSFEAGGVVDKVLVQVGDHVQAGQPLAWLDVTIQRAAVAEAEADLAQAQATYQDLLNAATPQEVTVAEAQLRQAQAQLHTTNGSVTSNDLRAAEAQLQQARAQLARLAAGPKTTDVRAAEAQLNLAQANLQTDRDHLSAAKSNTQLQMQQASDALVQAQASYATAQQNWQYVQDTGRDPINPWLGTDPKTGKKIPNKLSDAQRQQYYDAVIQAEAAMHSAEKAVQIAQVSYDNARQAEVSGIQAAEQQVSNAQANLDKLRAGADSDQLAAARAQVASSQANLEKLHGDQRAGTIESAQAAVDVAQANLDQIRAGASQSKLSIVQAQVQRARAALVLAHAMLDARQLKAPFAGVAASVDLKVGEYSAPGVPAIRLADFSAWQIETDDLTERSVVDVRVGAPARITFDAFPGLELAGRVARIDAFGLDKHGDTTYTVVVLPEQQDQRLRWNMTATVTISTARS
jgi:HlyD family secretion protein